MIERVANETASRGQAGDATATRARQAEIAIIGAGYVGVPLAHVFAEAGRSVVLVDVAEDVVAALNDGRSHIGDVPSDVLAPLVESGQIAATTSYDAVREADAILLALPTPLSKHREPDLSILLAATAEVGKRLRRGHLVVIESTTYPGTTRGDVLPILGRSGLEVGTEFNLAYSPERVDPGNERWTAKNVPKVVGGVTPACTKRAAEL